MRPTSAVLLAALLAAASGAAMAREDTSVSPYFVPMRTAISTDKIQDAKSRLPMLTDPSQIPAAISTTGTDAVAPMAYGTGNHPFTTKLASATATNRSPTNLPPWRQTGKLWMRFGSTWYVCTASPLKPGILVTAAHCVHNFGQGHDGWADEVIFEPARFGGAKPYGEWTATTWLIPTVYFNGTDVCTVSGVVCENDIAVVVMNQNDNGLYPGQVVGTYNYYRNSGPYVSFSGKVTAQITQLGYPSAFESGTKMIRTDSLGYQADPNNVLIGSAQTGGSSGGPWLMNFGTNPATTTDNPSWNHPNRVAAVTSWGYVSDTVKVLGASRFDTNTTYTSIANIDVLLNDACTAYPSRC